MRYPIWRKANYFCLGVLRNRRRRGIQSICILSIQSINWLNVMARYCFVLVLLVLNGCNVLDAGGPSDAIRITNRSNEAILPVIIELELSRLIDIYPPSLDYFSENKLESGESVDLVDIDGYERGDDIQLIIWQELFEGGETTNPDEIATIDVKYYELGSKALRLMSYHIEIKE